LNFAGARPFGFARDGVKDDDTGAGAGFACFGFFVSRLLRF